MKVMDAAERRARLARRHRLAPDDRANDVSTATRSMVCWHATTPSTVYLSARARVAGFTTAAMDKALYADRSVVKHLAMRRTLFGFPVDELDDAQAGASRRVAAAEGGRLAREVEKAGLHRDGAAWLERAKRAALDRLGDGRELTSTELRAEVPELAGSIDYGAGKRWGGSVPVGPRVLGVLSAEGRVVRASNDGAWTTSRPRWTAMEPWIGRPLADVDPADGLARLVRRWLATFGPGTLQDLKWWLGGTVGATRQALTDVGAVEVDLGGGTTGWVLPDDLEQTEPVQPWGALLPELDPTTMGWFERDWYLGEHRPHLFDRNGNGGNTAWWDGRVVGGWGQTDDGEVYLALLEDVGAEAMTVLEREAESLTRWLDGVSVPGRYPSPLNRRPAAQGGLGPA
jgi:prepilin-type processing-associated H-X9-DG protein